jgi:hypothetical protein
LRACGTYWANFATRLTALSLALMNFSFDLLILTVVTNSREFGVLFHHESAIKALGHFYLRRRFSQLCRSMLGKALPQKPPIFTLHQARCNLCKWLYLKA